MKTPKFKLGLRHRPIPEKIAICGALVRSLRRVPADAYAQAFLDKLDAAQTQAAEDEQETARLRASLAAAVARREENTRQMEVAAQQAAAAYTLGTRDEGELVAMGLKLENAPRPLPPPGAPTHLRAVSGLNQPGAVKLRWTRPQRRCHHEIEMTTDPNGQIGWKLVANGDPAHCVIHHLEPGTVCWFRVRAHGTAGPGPWATLQARVGW